MYAKHRIQNGPPYPCPLHIAIRNNRGGKVCCPAHREVPISRQSIILNERDLHMYHASGGQEPWVMCDSTLDDIFNIRLFRAEVHGTKENNGSLGLLGSWSLLGRH
ncbi:hypothetical protein CEXT_23831 [Caerostris extrusa]|uniref:Rieske domain-containing protein n=1 Tax=Caerostris extrusa TaxID=172846 RepID=A0AAV4WCR1_CAEEX|nr:hypothetical protein CEXT_23831 [Caerostris extrusa]